MCLGIVFDGRAQFKIEGATAAPAGFQRLEKISLKEKL
jgi:hypothetical protein